jgi:hypothetical protein
MIKDRSWRVSHGLAMWNYWLCSRPATDHSFECPQTPASYAVRMAVRTERLLSMLNPFAEPEEATVSTQAQGEDAVVFNLRCVTIRHWRH